jgi:hypothetical protein
VDGNISGKYQVTGYNDKGVGIPSFATRGIQVDDVIFLKKSAFLLKMSNSFFMKKNWTLITNYITI